MEIVYKDNQFKIKGKTGILYSKANGVLIESLDGNTSKELKGAGEYEVSEISVVGVKTEEGTVFVYEIDGFRVCNLDGLTKKLTDSKLSQIGDVDILLVPVTDESIEMTQQLESYYIIPFGYKTEEELEKFLKESGLVVEKMNKFSIKKEELVEDSTAQIVVLTD
ncbi:MAG: MBL fold metallo-hydrolase [Patescibacteria group bacterium]